MVAAPALQRAAQVVDQAAEDVILVLVARVLLGKVIMAVTARTPVMNLEAAAAAQVPWATLRLFNTRLLPQEELLGGPEKQV